MIRRAPRSGHAATFVGAVIAGVAALLLLAPIAVAVALLHGCDDATGPTLGGQIAIAAMIVAIVGGAAAVGGMLGGATARFVARLAARRD